jgi:NAD(P)-dependent dehydrogenase (short-subunit alcohol dehydrogenase family)
MVEKEGRKCHLIACDLGIEQNCRDVIEQTVKEFGRLDVLVNNAGEQHVVEHIQDLESQQLERTFETNIFSMFYLVKHAMKCMKKGEFRF